MLFALVLAVLASAQFAAVPGFGSALALFPYSFFNASCGVVVTTSSVSVFEQNFSFTAQFNVYDFLSGPGAKATAATAFVTPSQKAFLAIADSKGMLSFSSFTSCSSPFVFEASISGIPLGSGGAFAVRQYGLDMQFISANSLVTIGLVQSTNGPVPGVKRNQSLSIKSFAGAFSSSSGEFYHVEMLRNSHQRILGQNGFSGDFASAENVFSISSVVSNNKNFALFGYANLDGNPRVSVMFANGAKALTLEIAKGRALLGNFISISSFSPKRFSVNAAEFAYVYLVNGMQSILLQVMVSKQFGQPSVKLVSAWPFAIGTFGAPSMHAFVLDPPESMPFVFAIVERNGNEVGILQFDPSSPADDEFFGNLFESGGTCASGWLTSTCACSGWLTDDNFMLNCMNGTHLK